MVDSITSALTQKHPEYSLYEDKWEFWRDSSVGGSKFESKDEYLVQHPRERDEKNAYEWRKQLATYESHGKQVAEDWIARLYGPGLDFALVSPDKSTDQSTLLLANAITDNIDLLGTSLVNFAKKTDWTVITQGCCGVVVDVPPDAFADNLGQAISGGVRPYCRIIEPANIIDWEFDRQSKLEWVKIREVATLPRKWFETQQLTLPAQSLIASANPPIAGQIYYRYFIIDRESITRFEPTDKSEQFIQYGPVSHGLDVVPFQMFYGKPAVPGLMFQPPLIEEIYGFDRLIYNMRSGLTDLMFNQMFSILTMATVGGKQNNNTIGVGTMRALGYPGGTGAPPSFISPDSRLVEAHLKAIEDAEKAIKRISKGVNVTMVDDKVREASGRSKAFDSDPLTTLLREIGDNQEPAFRNLFTIIHKRSPFANKKISVRAKFPDSIVQRGVLEEREDTVAACGVLSCSEKAVKLLVQNFASQVLRSIWNPEEKDEILKEIQGAPLNAIIAQMLGAVGEEKNGSGDPSSQELRPGEGSPRDSEQPGPRVRAA
jgi:hypothetical protein